MTVSAQRQPNPIQLIISLLVDYFRWSQLTPMILMWAVILGLLFALFFVSFEDQTWTMIGALTEWVTSLPWLGPKLVAYMESQAEDGVISPDLGAIDFKSAVLWVWGVISLGLMAIGWVAGLFFGPFKPWTLKRKLGAAAIACMMFVVIMMTLYFLDPETWNDGPVKNLLSASGIALVMFLVNAWCLSVSHALGLLSRFIAEADFSSNASGSEDGLI